MNVANVKEQLLSISKKHDLIDAAKRISDIKPEDILIKVAFLGEFKAGKSTLINALLGRKILPMFADPTTAVITEISKGTEDKFFAVKNNEELDEVTQEISIGQLAEEIMKADINKKVLVQLKDLAFLDDKLLIIDTPGVSSIEKTHSDVTFGYLPQVDVAFIVMNINIGAPTKSLIDFLKQYPKEMLSKIYFVLNYTDTINTEKVEKTKTSFVKILSEVIDNPRVIPISAQNALDIKLGKIKDVSGATGLPEIEGIIKQEIPQFNMEIENKRTMALFKLEAKKLIALLETKLKSLKWDTNEFDENMKKFTYEIENIEKDLRNFKEKYRRIKEDCIERIQKLIKDEYVPTISTYIAKEKAIDGLVDSMIQDINQVVENSLKQIKSSKLNSLNINVSQIIQSSIEKQTAVTKEIADLLTDIGTFVLTVFVVPAGAGSKAGEAAAKGAHSLIPTIAEGSSGIAVPAIEKMSKVSQSSSKVLKSIGMVGKILKDINPLERLKRIALPFIINPRLRTKLSSTIVSRLDLVFSEFELLLEEEIENNYLIPLKEKEKLIEGERGKRDTRRDNIDTLKKSIKEDMELLNKLS